MTNAREIVRALGGRWHGRYGLAYCPAHANRRTPALSFGDVAAALRSRWLLHGAGRGYQPDPAAEARRAAEDRPSGSEASARRCTSGPRPSRSPGRWPRHICVAGQSARRCLGRALERWRWTGQGHRFLKAGNRIAYRLEDVEAWEAERLRTSTCSSPDQA